MHISQNCNTQNDTVHIIIKPQLKFIFLECMKACEKFLSHRWNALWYSVLKRLLALIKNFKNRETHKVFHLFSVWQPHIGTDSRNPRKIGTILPTWKCTAWMRLYLIWKSHPNMYHHHSYQWNFVFMLGTGQATLLA